MRGFTGLLLLVLLFVVLFSDRGSPLRRLALVSGSRLHAAFYHDSFL